MRIPHNPLHKSASSAVPLSAVISFSACGAHIDSLYLKTRSYLRLFSFTTYLPATAIAVLLVCLTVWGKVYSHIKNIAEIRLELKYFLHKSYSRYLRSISVVHLINFASSISVKKWQGRYKIRWHENFLYDKYYQIY